MHPAQPRPPAGVLAARVLALIEERDGGNVAAAARRVGIAQPSLHEITTGKAANPRAETVAKIARAYGVPMEYLLGLQDEPTATYGAGFARALAAMRSALERIEAAAEGELPRAGRGPLSGVPLAEVEDVRRRADAEAAAGATIRERGAPNAEPPSGTRAGRRRQSNG